jgi:hypothetical protein
MNTTIYKIADLLKPEGERDLRILAAEILTPKDLWRHRLEGSFACVKCGAEYYAPCREFHKGEELVRYCSIPDPRTDLMEVVAARLVSKVLEVGDRRSMGGGYILLTYAIEELHELTTGDEQFACWLMFTPIEQAICALLSLLPERIKP